MESTIYIAAAFTDQQGAGSPTSVVLKADGLTDDQMQRIARATTCSHTAFIIEPAQANDPVGVRFFTASGEIKNCGHGTIAAHIVRAEKGDKKLDGIIQQRTASGLQEVCIQRENGVTTVWLKQDAIRFCDLQADIQAELISILGVSASALDNQYPIILASPGANRFLVALNDAAAVHGLKPNIAALKALGERVQSIGCFAYALNAEHEAVARMFAPNIGVDEDVTNGNSSGCLGAYLLHLDPSHPAQLSLRVHQGYAFNRPGTVLVKVSDRGYGLETIIGGTAVIEPQVSITL